MILDKARLAAGLPVLTDKEMQLSVSVWAEILEPIRTDKLNDCYLQAIRAHDAGKPFNASELMKAWNEMVASGALNPPRLVIAPAPMTPEEVAESRAVMTEVLKDLKRLTGPRPPILTRAFLKPTRSIETEGQREMRIAELKRQADTMKDEGE